MQVAPPASRSKPEPVCERTSVASEIENPLGSPSYEAAAPRAKRGSRILAIGNQLGESPPLKATRARSARLQGSSRSGIRSADPRSADKHGRCRTRTCGHLRVKQALYQLS
jgi:hypothetical protein